MGAVSEICIMRKKKKVTRKKTVQKKRNKKTLIEKTYGDPQPVRPVSEYYNTETYEPYPKLIFRQDSLWTRIKRFFGFIP